MQNSQIPSQSVSKCLAWRSRKSRVAAGKRPPSASKGLTANVYAGSVTESSQASPDPSGERIAGRQNAERIALVAKDFQNQAQWALAAMPAPIFALMLE